MVKEKLKRIIISAVSANGVIGSNNKIPWHSKEELKHFKNTTFGHPVLMGRKTFQSLDNVLEGRLNIVISARKITDKNVLTFSSVGKAYQYLRKNKYEKVYICGGGRIYRNTVRHAEEMIISWMNFNTQGNIYFPKINKAKWKIINEEQFKDFVVKYYLRI
ncbi:MAG: diacylglycerol kinase [Ignavibacteriae bacterium]|nr:MAG: diacylglycerol kinase [Ignavibacteriota bacterium]